MAKYDVIKDTSRPFRLYDSKEKTFLRWRYYSNIENAHDGACIEARWAPVGRCIEVVDVTKGKMIGQYTRRVNDIHLLGPKDKLTWQR